MRTSTHTHTRTLIVVLVAVVLATANSISASTQAASSSGPASDTKLKPASANAKEDARHHQLSASADQLQVADKKQGEQADLFNSEEYVQIKPEEITVNEQNKDVEPNLSLDSAPSGAPSASRPTGAAGRQQLQAEHKSADDELNAHLAQDTISSLESSYRPYAAPSHQMPAPRAGYQPRGPRRPTPGGHGRGPRGMPPPNYMAYKGKQLGAPHMMPPQMRPAPRPYSAGPQAYGPLPPPPPTMQSPYGPRYFPRGAAAGYAAFREFVRVQANKYKPIAGYGGGPHEPAAYNAAMNHNGGRYNGEPTMVGKPAGYAPPPPPPPPPAPAPVAAPQRPASKTKVTVAQAYIPHLSPSSKPYGGGDPSSSGYATNPILAKLYGGHAPQGVGKPEYSKDYGMVIHYPQATVFTEPMTVDQLHKLAGAGISQILEQLQYNLATGQRDESNTIRANDKHHIGNGMTIHAKEYYAPGKSGNYVPTTAAVISTSSAPSKTGYETPAQEAAGGYQQPAKAQATYQAPAANGAGEPAAYGIKQDLGSGYERVKAAVAASMNSAKYNAGTKAQALQAASDGAKSYENEATLGALSSLFGNGELDALYKANAALNKQLEPEIHAQIQSYAESAHAKAPLKFTEHDYRSPLALHAPTSPYNGQQQQQQPQPQPQQPRYGPQGAPARPHQQPRGRGSRRQQHQPAGPGYNRYPAARPQQRPARPGQYQQQRPYNAAEQAVQQQMMQLLRDFQLGDDQYNSKSQSMQAPNQGYPNKIMQKYQQRPQQAQQSYQPQAQMGSYNSDHNDALEIPQSPNDQIGEISELLEALRGSLEASGKPEDVYAMSEKSPGKLDDVRYLSSTLGQVPSYAMQVPVSSTDASQKGAGTGYSQQSAPATGQPAASAQQQPNYSQSAGEQIYGTYPAQSETGPDQNSYQQPQASAGLTSGQQQAAYGQMSAQGNYQQQPTFGGYQQAATPAQTADYGQQGAQAEGGQQAGGQQAYQQPAASAQLQTSGYTASEHTQVINHLVPVTQYQQQAVGQQPQAASSYDSVAQQPQQPAAPQALVASVSTHQQPANQISIAAPTDSQYQAAQPLSSFVDSLPNDYQELLRQPASPMLDGAASGHESVYSNATSSSLPAGGDILKSSAQQQGPQAANHDTQRADNVQTTSQSRASYIHQHQQASGASAKPSVSSSSGAASASSTQAQAQQSHSLQVKK